MNTTVVAVEPAHRSAPATLRVGAAASTASTRLLHVVAEYLGLSVRDLRERLRAGDSLGNIALAQNTDMATVTQVLRLAIPTVMQDNAVAAAGDAVPTVPSVSASVDLLVQ